MKLLALAAFLVATTEIAPGVVLIPGQLSKDRSPDGNSVLLHGPEGWVVIDTGRGGEHTDLLLRFFADTEAGPSAVLNTHWHLDHIGGNADFRREWPKTRILAHPAIDSALAGFHAANRDQLEKLVPTLMDKPELKARLETELALLKLDRELAASESVTSSRALSLAGRALDLHVETRAVSDGDIWILDRESKTLISGDLVTLPVPLFDTACPEGWQQALSRVAAVDFEVLVPGHGEPMTRESFSAYRRGFDALLACAGSSAENAACIEGWFRDVKAADSPYARELLDYYLKQFLRPEAPGRKRWCEGARNRACTGGSHPARLCGLSRTRPLGVRAWAETPAAHDLPGLGRYDHSNDATETDIPGYGRRLREALVLERLGSRGPRVERPLRSHDLEVARPPRPPGAISSVSGSAAQHETHL